MKKIQKRYCEYCGKVMNTKKLFCGFDRFTGKEKPWVRYVCPELDWDKLQIDERFNANCENFMGGHYYFYEKLY